MERGSCFEADKILGILEAALSILVRCTCPTVTDERQKDIARAHLLADHLMEVEDRAAAQAWFNSPQLALGGKTPLDYADTELGAREVENLLNRIGHGVFV